jgi:hypothetical protein
MYSYPGPVIVEPSGFVATGKFAVAGPIWGRTLGSVARLFSQPLHTVV